MRIKHSTALNVLVGALIGLPVAAAEMPGFYRYTTAPGDTLIGIGATMLRRPEAGGRCSASTVSPTPTAWQSARHCAFRFR